MKIFNDRTSSGILGGSGRSGGGVLLVLWQLGDDVRCEQDGLQEKLKVFGEFHVRVRVHSNTIY